MRTVEDINFNGKKAVVRVDFNVPLNENGEVTDNTRMRAAMPTIKKILDDGGSVIILSHLGRPFGFEESKSLGHLIPELKTLTGKEVKFGSDCIGPIANDLSSALNGGEVLLLENLRFHQEETKGDEAFAKQLAELGDVYVNDAFGTAHRAHASTTIMAQYFEPENKCFGKLMAAEIANANKVFKDAEKPFSAILGGAKVSGKIMIIERLLDLCDHILIGGGMAYTFAKAEGGSIGNSLLEEDRMDTALEIIEAAKAKGVQLHLPTDSIIADNYSNEANTDTASNDSIPDGWMGLDIGPETIKSFSEVIHNSKTILWNGPMGVFEMEKFQKGTIAIADAVAEATSKGAYSLVGGGDSVAAVNRFGYADKVSYVSTGGGAMLEFFEGKTLPGIAAMNG